MKDAIIVRKVTGPFSHEWNDWRRRDEETTGTIFDHFVTDPRTVFSWRKNHAPNQKAGAEDNNHFFKESHSKIRRRDKKRTSSLFEKHEKEIGDFVKAQNPKVESVQIDWNSMQIEESGNGTPQGGGYNLSISGKINQLENTKFSVDFYLEDQNSIPTIKKMGMLNDIYIEENGGWKIFS